MTRTLRCLGFLVIGYSISVMWMPEAWRDRRSDAQRWHDAAQTYLVRNGYRTIAITEAEAERCKPYARGRNVVCFTYEAEKGGEVYAGVLLGVRQSHTYES
jgi:hypothetical protein